MSNRVKVGIAIWRSRLARCLIVKQRRPLFDCSVGHTHIALEVVERDVGVPCVVGALGLEVVSDMPAELRRDVCKLLSGNRVLTLTVALTRPVMISGLSRFGRSVDKIRVLKRQRMRVSDDSF